MWRTHGRGLPAWIRLRRNQKAETAAIPATNTQNALQRASRGTTKTAPIAITAATPAIVSFEPRAIPMARPATSRAPKGAAAAGAFGDWPAVRGRAAQALIRIAAAARSIATGTVSVAGV